MRQTTDLATSSTWTSGDLKSHFYISCTIFFTSGISTEYLKLSIFFCNCTLFFAFKSSQREKDSKNCVCSAWKTEDLGVTLMQSSKNWREPTGKLERAHSDRTRGNCFKLKEGRFGLDIWSCFQYFMVVFQSISTPQKALLLPACYLWQRCSFFFIQIFFVCKKCVRFYIRVFWWNWKSMVRQVKMPYTPFCLHGIVAEMQEHRGRILQRADVEGTIRLEASMCCWEEKILVNHILFFFFNS